MNYLNENRSNESDKNAVLISVFACIEWMGHNISYKPTQHPTQTHTHIHMIAEIMEQFGPIHTSATNTYSHKFNKYASRLVENFYFSHTAAEAVAQHIRLPSRSGRYRQHCNMKRL